MFRNKLPLILGTAGFILTSCQSPSSTITFEKSVIESENADKVSCTIKVVQTASSEVNGKSDTKRSFTISTKQEAELETLELIDLTTNSPKVRGNNGSVLLEELGKSPAPGYKTYLETDTANNGIASVYSYNAEFHKIIWSKTYGYYSHIGVGYCK